MILKQERMRKILKKEGERFKGNWWSVDRREGGSKGYNDFLDRSEWERLKGYYD
jgi:hypothetical protein